MLGRCRVENQLDALRVSRLGIGHHRRHRYFELQQQVREAIQRGQIRPVQRQIGTRCYCDGIFCIIRDADKRRACRLVFRTHHMHLHPGSSQGRLQWCGIGIVTQGQQHVCGGSASLRASDRLVGPFAAWKSLEIPSQHGFTRRGYVGGANNKIEIG